MRMALHGICCFRKILGDPKATELCCREMLTLMPSLISASVFPGPTCARNFLQWQHLIGKLVINREQPLSELLPKGSADCSGPRLWLDEHLMLHGHVRSEEDPAAIDRGPRPEAASSHSASEGSSSQSWASNTPGPPSVRAGSCSLHTLESCGIALWMAKSQRLRWEPHWQAPDCMLPVWGWTVTPP